VEVDLDRVALVGRGLFEVDAVRQDLNVDLLLQDGLAKRSPACPRPAGEEDASVEEAECLAGQMGIRRGVAGEVALEVGSVSTHPREHLRNELRREVRRLPEEHEGPAPGNDPERHLEAARPVDSETRRVGAEPATSEVRERLRIALVTGRSIGYPQGHEKLLAAQLPDHLAVAEGDGIRGVDQAPVDER
jgi:hypothetical protein